MAERSRRDPESAVEAALLAALGAAEWDDEPLTAEAIASIEEGGAAFHRGE